MLVARDIYCNFKYPKYKVNKYIYLQSSEIRSNNLFLSTKYSL